MTESAQNGSALPEPEFPLGRLFVVPSIIIGVIILCAVVVVLSFGAIASDKEKPISQVLAVLEAGSGEKTAGVLLMPQDKEMWQAAQELALRLENVEAEVAPDDLPEVRARLTKLLERDLGESGRLQRRGKQRMFFIMRAAAKAGAAQAVPVLIEALGNADSEVRREALGALALMQDIRQARARAGRIAHMLSDAEPVVRMLACVALSNLADRGDSNVIEALSDAYLTDEEQDVRWNAALTLARLGSSHALPTMADMLTRRYWQKQRVQYESLNGSAVDHLMTDTPNRIDDYLITAIDAASNLDDKVVWNLIEDLADDQASKVAARAKHILAARRRSSPQDDVTATEQD